MPLQAVTFSSDNGLHEGEMCGFALVIPMYGTNYVAPVRPRERCSTARRGWCGLCGRLGVLAASPDAAIAPATRWEAQLKKLTIQHNAKRKVKVEDHGSGSSSSPHLIPAPNPQTPGGPEINCSPPSVSISPQRHSFHSFLVAAFLFFPQRFVATRGATS
jgi:hypothetical protein